MSSRLIRNAITLCLILSLANLAAMLAARQTVQTFSDKAQVRMQHIETTLAQLSIATAHLCAERGDVCKK